MRDVSNFIDTAKDHIAREYNSTQVVLYWLIGVMKFINNKNSVQKLIVITKAYHSPHE